MSNCNLQLSSITKKLIMGITGGGLVIFLLFHGVMNLVAVFSGEGYNAICEFLGANWYAIVGTIGLAVLVVLHLIFAFILSWQNYRSRGSERYAIVARNEGVSWASRNMLILGLCVIIGLVLHLYNFWYNMQWQELKGLEPVDGVEQLRNIFGHAEYSILYLIWFVCIYLHLTHGISSVLQSIGWNNEVWERRIDILGKITAMIILLMFVTVVIYFWLIA